MNLNLGNPVTIVASLVFAASSASAQLERRDEQFYYPGSFNWVFLRDFPQAGRLFNAFDYGHAILYETLLTEPGAPVSGLEEREYDFIVGRLLKAPPRLPIAEEAIEPNYARLAWKAKRMFDWAHMLHRQIYDVYADDRIADKDAAVDRLVAYYLGNREYALAAAPKSMHLMDEQYYSQVFRQRYPKFNGLIWAYHWLQVGLYEPLIAGATPGQRRAMVDTAMARFWRMLEAPPSRMPEIMPMTPTVAPLFTTRHPDAAAIFDNLHMLHDIISDILASDKVRGKRAAIYEALAEFQDTTRHVMGREEWWEMGEMMGGVEAMGGPVLERQPSAVSPSQDTAAVRGFVEALGRAMEAGDLAALDTLFAPDPWVEIIEGAGVNHGWVDYRDNHLKPELAEMQNLRYRFFEVLPQVRGSVAWAPFRYELAADVPTGHVEVEGRGTVVLERRSGRWLVVQLHTSGRRKPAR